MRVSSYLSVLVAFCTLGGLLLAGVVFERQLALDTESEQIAKSVQLQNDTLRFSDQLKQLFTSTDLLFASQETYMIQASLQQANAALRLCTTAYRGFDGQSPRALSYLHSIHQDVAALINEIAYLETQAQQVEFAVDPDTLNRVDDISLRVVEATYELQEIVLQNARAQKEAANQHRSDFDLRMWSLGGLYVFGVLAALLWTARSVSRPLRALSKSADSAYVNRETFQPPVSGPTEVLELTDRIGSFVNSLELEIKHTKALVDAIPDTLFVLDRNKGLVRLLPGIDTPKSLVRIERTLDTLISMLGPVQTAEIRRNILHCLDNQVFTEFDLALDFSGEQRFYEARATPVTADEVIVLVRDLTEKRKAESRIQYLAYHDGLTGLLNRTAFTKQFSDTLANEPELPFALFVIDVDRFKIVNDTQGHEVGDLVLKHITQCLRECLRDDDSVTSIDNATRSTPARLGGDEFVALIRNVSDHEQAIRISDRLVKAIEQPVYADGTNVSVSASVGIALYPEHGSAAGELLNHADLAMYRAKSDEDNRSFVYDHALGEVNRRKLTMEAKLRKAIDNDDLFLAYQPKLDLSTRSVVGVEALVRWRDDDQIIPPLEFIPLAEETGLILPLGDYVISAATQQLAAWKQRGLHVEHIAINVSAPQFHQAEFVPFLIRAVDQAGLDYSMVNVEVTESLLMEQYDEFVKVLRNLHERGFGIAMDDFGTGYSSLSYLKDLPLDILKIDRAFVSGVTQSDVEREIIGTIIKLGKTLGLTVVAEGVETEAQARYLLEAQCDQVQGYLFSPPLSAEDCEQFLVANQAPPTQVTHLRTGS